MDKLLVQHHLQHMALVEMQTHLSLNIRVHFRLREGVCMAKRKPRHAVCITHIHTYIHAYKKTTYERLSKLLVHGQTMDDLGGSYRFTRIPSHVAVRYRFALVKVKRPSNSLILLVVCPALYCPLLPFTLLLFTAFYCPSPALYCPVLLFTAFYCPLPALYGPLLHFTALYCPLLPFTAWGSGS